MDKDTDEICKALMMTFVTDSLSEIKKGEDVTWDAPIKDFVITLVFSYFASMRKSVSGDIDASQIEMLIEIFYADCERRTKNQLGELLRKLEDVTPASI